MTDFNKLKSKAVCKLVGTPVLVCEDENNPGRHCFVDAEKNELIVDNVKAIDFDENGACVVTVRQPVVDRFGRISDTYEELRFAFSYAKEAGATLTPVVENER